MNCPKCRKSALKASTHRGAGVSLDVCARCKGVWFDARELELIMDVALRDLDLPPEAGLGARPCPRCSRPLHNFYYPQTYVRVDMCAKCKGLWLDHREFKEIQQVRQARRDDATDEEDGPVRGAKGAVLRFIDAAIEALNSP